VKDDLLQAVPAVAAPLDPAFAPASLVNRRYRAAVAAAAARERVGIALERDGGCVCRHDLEVLPWGSAADAATLRVLERHVKMLLWVHGGWRLTLSGAPALCERIRAAYSRTGGRRFDVELMERVYERPFETVVAEEDVLPEPRGAGESVGGHVDGCRIGFDLGASDYKLAAVDGGKAVFSTEVPWHPVVEKDPAYHDARIREGLRQAAAHLPRVDAIGGSSAGIIVNNRVRVASLFRAVPAERFDREVVPIFLRLQQEWGVPLTVVNDGDVSALAGAMAFGGGGRELNGMLGVAMGSSEAVGYLDRAGCITGQLNELAFAPVDFNEHAVADEWSGDRGVGALYFSQQAVNKLAPAAGIAFPAEMLLPERLKDVQARAEAGDRAAEAVFETIGVYFGYALAHYADYYAFDNLLFLGRVTSGCGGELILARAKETLKTEFPALAERLALRVPDEKSRRVGQAVAAASLPALAEA
jgi:predicted NBD/HSP70 family sugar kinase